MWRSSFLVKLQACYRLQLYEQGFYLDFKSTVLSPPWPPPINWLKPPHQILKSPRPSTYITHCLQQCKNKGPLNEKCSALFNVSDPDFYFKIGLGQSPPLLKIGRPLFDVVTPWNSFSQLHFLICNISSVPPPIRPFPFPSIPLSSYPLHTEILLNFHIQNIQTNFRIKRKRKVHIFIFKICTNYVIVDISSLQFTL